jgi:hypothetical protein
MDDVQIVRDEVWYFHACAIVGLIELTVRPVVEVVAAMGSTMVL